MKTEFKCEFKKTNLKSFILKETNLPSSFALKLGLDLKTICPTIIIIIALEQLGSARFLF